MVPYGWLIEAMKMLGIADTIVNLLKTAKRYGEQS